MPGPISDSYQGPDGGADPYFEGDQGFRDGLPRSSNPYRNDTELEKLWLDGWDDAASDASQNANRDWETGVGLQTNVEMRERIRELTRQGGTDDYDKAVGMLLHDFSSLKVIISAQADKIKHLEEVSAKWASNFGTTTKQ